MRGYRRIIQYALRQWPGLLAIVAVTVAGSAVGVLQPWPMKLLFDQALGHEPIHRPARFLLHALALQPGAMSLVFVAAVLSLGLFIVSSLLDAALSWAWTSVGQRMVFDLAGDLFSRMQRLSLLFHAHRSVGDSLNRLSGDSWCVYTVTEGLLVAPVQHLTTLAMTGAVAYWLDPRLALVMMAAAPVLGASAFFFGRHIKGRARADREAVARLTGFVHQALTAMPVVQAFGTETQNRRQFRRLADRSVEVARQGAVLRGGFSLVNGLATSVGVAIVLYLGGKGVLLHNANPHEGIPLGTLLVFMAYVNSLRAASQGLLNTYANLRTAEASIDRVLEILDAKEIIVEKPGAVAAAGGRDAGHIRIEHATFGYEPDRPVLTDVSLEARPGQLVALVGPTGAGKSTLISLVPRFFDPWQGKVILGGLDVRDLQLASLRSKVSLVLQEPFLLPLSIAENIAYGRPGAPMDQVIAAAAAADAHGFITALPQGYQTVLGERGATLSGGQRQRLAIARAILKDAPVLILDEPTSALDAQTESSVLSALEKLMANRTTLVIAHRLSTVRRADKILVLEHGRIVEQGTHDQLIDAQGAYHKLHGLQFGTLAPSGPSSGGGGGEGVA